MVNEHGTDETVSLSAEELDRLFNIGIALSAEQDMDVLLENILTAAKEFCNAEGGTLYLMDPAQNQLVFSILHNDKLGIKMGGTSEKRKFLSRLCTCTTRKPTNPTIPTYRPMPLWPKKSSTCPTPMIQRGLIFRARINSIKIGIQVKIVLNRSFENQNGAGRRRVAAD